MLKLKSILFAHIFLFFLFSSVTFAEMTSTNYKISPMVFSACCNITSSANFSLVTTLGQSSSLGNSTSTNFRIDSGYWYSFDWSYLFPWILFLPAIEQGGIQR